MTGGQLPLLMVGGLALFAVLLGVWQLQVSRKLQREVDELREQVFSQPASENEPVNFSTSLDSVERQQLQAAPPQVRNSADKYSYVGSMAAQGLDAEGIAEVLQMPIAEVEQLLRLARLKQTAPNE